MAKAKKGGGEMTPVAPGGGEITTPPSTPTNHSEIGENQVKLSSTPQTHSEIPEKPMVAGPGRPAKYGPTKYAGSRPAKYAGPFIEAMSAAGMAITALSRIADDDATRVLGRVRAPAKGRVRGGGEISPEFLMVLCYKGRRLITSQVKVSWA